MGLHTYEDKAGLLTATLEMMDYDDQVQWVMDLMKSSVGIFEFILENEAEDVIVSVAEGKVPHLFYREDD